MEFKDETEREEYYDDPGHLNVPARDLLVDEGLVGVLERVVAALKAEQSRDQ